MRIQVPRGGALPRTQVTAIGVIAGVLSLAAVGVLSSGMALLPAAILTLVVAVVILLVVGTVIATFSEPLQRLTNRVFADDEDEGSPGGRPG
ncbi:MAG: hypothetical protein M3Y91_13075 [Actinomycetota bacterium]|nr:hypothetical protein [Actinomycetota bacterium]